MSISSTLIKWYLQKKRNLPWRNTSNPYHIWVSEIVLQQTRVAQGTGYYERFISSFPDMKSLANAEIDDVLKVWQGLGYYTRARNLYAGAKYVVQQLNGNLPANFDELKKINGIGEYTAAAIGSFAFNLPLAVVDGNVNRVIARIFGIHEPVNFTSGIKQIKEIAEKILDTNNPGLHNQAIMEFGALQCVVHNPDCSVCPLQNTCYAWLHNETGLLPVKLKQQKVRVRFFNYIVLQHNNNIVINKRLEKDIWEGLYEFPLIETDNHLSEKKLMNLPVWKTMFESTAYRIEAISQVYKHQLSHQTINARFLVVSTDNISGFVNAEMLVISCDAIYEYPVSKLIDNYLQVLGLRSEKI